jgi:SAM-dependent methyltransferase
MPTEWDGVASLRRKQIESGADLTFSKVFIPLYRNLLASLGADSILEVGVGTGHLAAELRDLTSRYVGLEPSKGMFLEAKDVLQGRQVELVETSLEDWKSTTRFDLILTHMCLQTVDNHQRFIESMASLLNHGGAFLITIPHPAFFNEYKKVIPQISYSYMREQGTTIDFAITLDPSHPIRSVPYFHRPLSSYVAAVVRSGLALSFLHELNPPADIQSLYGEPWKTPRYLVFGGEKVSRNEISDTVATRLINLSAPTSFSASDHGNP